MGIRQLNLRILKQDPESSMCALMLFERLLFIGVGELSNISFLFLFAFVSLAVQFHFTVSKS